MRRNRLPAVLAAALGLAALQVAVVAGPAAADHIVDVNIDGSGCSKDILPFAIPIRLQTDRSVVRTLRDGTIQGRCHFRGLPERILDGGDTWVRPTEATRLVGAVCQLRGEGLDRFGIGEALVTPAGTLKVTCTFRPQF